MARLFTNPKPKKKTPKGKTIRARRGFLVWAVPSIGDNSGDTDGPDGDADDGPAAAPPSP